MIWTQAGNRWSAEASSLLSPPASWTEIRWRFILSTRRAPEYLPQLWRTNHPRSSVDQMPEPEPQELLYLLHERLRADVEELNTAHRQFHMAITGA